MTTFDSGGIVLLRFPFTDRSSAKKRPAVILSSRQYSLRYGDIVIVPLTSVPQTDDGLCLDHWKESGLLKPTWVKPLLATLSVSLVERLLGKISRADTGCVRCALRHMLSPGFLPEA